jgi:uncharacterized protein YacL
MQNKISEKFIDIMVLFGITIMCLGGLGIIVGLILGNLIVINISGLSIIFGFMLCIPVVWWGVGELFKRRIG